MWNGSACSSSLGCPAFKPWSDLRGNGEVAWVCGALAEHSDRLLQMGKPDLARNCAEEALRASQGDSGAVARAWAHTALARVCTREGERDQARRHADQAYALTQEEPGADALRGVLQKLVDVYGWLDAEGLSLACAQSVVDICRDGDDRLDLGFALANLAACHKRRKEWKQALPIYDEAYAVLQASPELHKIPAVPWRLADDISDCCIGMGDLARAIETMERERTSHRRWAIRLGDGSFRSSGPGLPECGDLHRSLAASRRRSITFSGWRRWPHSRRSGPGHSNTRRDRAHTRPDGCTRWWRGARGQHET